MWFLFAQVIGLPLVPGCFTQNHGDPTSLNADVVTAVGTRGGVPIRGPQTSLIITKVIRRGETASNTDSRFR